MISSLTFELIQGSPSFPRTYDSAVVPVVLVFSPDSYQHANSRCLAIVVCVLFRLRRIFLWLVFSTEARHCWWLFRRAGWSSARTVASLVCRMTTSPNLSLVKVLWWVLQIQRLQLLRLLPTPSSFIGMLRE